MIASTDYSPSNFSFPCLTTTRFSNQNKKHPLLILATKIIIFILCCHALFNHNAEREVEIEEEEPELVVMLSPVIKRNTKKEYL